MTVFFAIAALLVLPFLVGWALLIRMPGRSFSGPLPALSTGERIVAGRLASDLQMLAGDIGERNIEHPEAYRRAADWIETSFGETAGYRITRETFELRQQECRNIVAEKKGGSRATEIVIIGAHYDSVSGTAGANDNGSGTVSLLALARALDGVTFARTVRFVAFANEEPPYFKDPVEMGSAVYLSTAQKRGDRIAAMFSLETMGYFSEAKGSQKYPFPFSLLYPSTGNFIGFVGNVSSRSLVKQSVGAFRSKAQFPSQGAAIPGSIPGVDWSDQWAFWNAGIPAVMVTDTAPFRYPHYHLRTDTPDKVDSERLARVVTGLLPVIEAAAGGRE